MSAYPVHYFVASSPQFTRLQLLVRVVAFAALGILGISFGAVFAALFLGLPALATIRMLSFGRDGYLRHDGPHVLSVLRWVAAISAWAGLTTDRLPTRDPDESIRIVIDDQPRWATPSSALVRILTGLPSACVLAMLCVLGTLVWMWAALSVLVTERVGPHAHAYLVGLQRWSVRLFAYQAALVDEYPPFSFSESASSGIRTAHAVV